MTSTLDTTPSVDGRTVWTAVCRLDDIQPERAVCAIVGPHQVAIVRTHDDEVRAVSQRDPFSGAFVMSRGIVGTRRLDDADVPVLQSPLFKQSFNLRTGQCLDDADVAITVFDVRERNGVVEVLTAPSGSP